MANYVYLFRLNHATQRSMSLEQMQQNMTKWMGWIETLGPGFDRERILLPG